MEDDYPGPATVGATSLALMKVFGIIFRIRGAMGDFKPPVTLTPNAS